MLTAEHIDARKRQGKLLLAPLSGGARQECLSLAEQLLVTWGGSIGDSREELEALVLQLGTTGQEKLWIKGLSKLLEDAASFSSEEEGQAVELRRAVFWEAARNRRELEAGQAFERERVLAAVAAAHDTTPSALDERLYADLPGAQRLVTVPAWTPLGLLERYEFAKIQAVLLRAERLMVTFRIGDVEVVRRLFRSLRFRQLLFQLEREDGGRYRLTVDGPISLFEGCTRYGLQLALVLPLILELPEPQLSAELRWGKRRERLLFELKGPPVGLPVGADAPAVRTCSDEVTQLVEELSQLCPDWSVEFGTELLELTGVGLIVPDLRITLPTGECVHVELLGYWSRDAVWRRIELVEAGLVEPLLFIVSSRLRVSEAVLSEDATAALYVYKGKISARAVRERLLVLSQRLGFPKRGGAKVPAAKKSAVKKPAAKPAAKEPAANKSASKKSRAKPSAAKKSRARELIGTSSDAERSGQAALPGLVPSGPARRTT